MTEEKVVRPEYVPKDWLLVKAPDGCTYWAKPDVVGNPNFFFSCKIAEDETKDEAWHKGDELEVIKEESEE